MKSFHVPPKTVGQPGLILLFDGEVWPFQFETGAAPVLREATMTSAIEPVS